MLGGAGTDVSAMMTNTENKNTKLVSIEIHVASQFRTLQVGTYLREVMVGIVMSSPRNAAFLFGTNSNQIALTELSAVNPKAVNTLRCFGLV